MRLIGGGLLALFLLAPGAAAGQEPPSPPAATKPESEAQTADKVLAAVAAKDDAALKALAAKNAPDPWLVADELLRRGEADAAEAFAKAAPRPDTESLPAYVASRRGKEDDPKRRERAAAINAAMKAGKADEALAAAGDAEAGPLTDIAGIRIAMGRATALSALERHDAADETFRSAGEAAERVGWLAYASKVRRRAAETFENAGESELAIAAAEAWIAVDERRGDTSNKGKILIGIATTLLRAKQWERAAGVLERAAQAYEANGDEEGLAKSLGNLGIAYGRLGRWDQALTAFERTLKICEAAGDAAGVANTLKNIVVTERKRGDVARARVACERLVGQMEKMGDEAGAARFRVELAALQQDSGDPDAAIVTYKRVLADAEANGDDHTAAIATRGIGNSLAVSGRYAEALTALQRSQDALEELGDSGGAAASQRSVAGVLLELGEIESSLANYTRAIAAFDALGLELESAKALYSLANVQDAAGKTDDALASMKRALDVFRKLGAEGDVAITLSNIGATQAAHGRHADAVKTLEAARAALEELGDTAAATNALLNIGIAQSETGADKEALVTLERALAGFEEIGDRRGVACARGGIGRALLDLGDVAKALPELRRAATGVAALTTGLGAEEGVGAREDLSYIYNAGILAAVAAGDPAELLFFLESSRAGALIEGLRARSTLWSAAVPDELRAADAKAREASASATRALAEATASGDRRAIKEARTALDAAEEKVAAVVARIQREARAGASLVAPQSATLDEVRATLADGDVLVLYGEGDETTVALVTTKTESRVVRVGPTERLAEAAAALALSDAAIDPAAQLENLRALAVDPLALDAKSTRLLVSPTGALAYVPFATLAGKRDVVLVPSATTYRLLIEDAAKRGDGVLALGDPDYTGRKKLPPLPATAAEVKAVGDVVLTGRQATEQGLRDAVAKKARWRSIHLACHGLIDAQVPMRSSLALTADGSDDGFLSAVDVFRMKLPADLVVLAACETGRGKVYEAEGIVGLTRAFMFSGSPRVICSLWKVDDEATCALMTKFYELWNPKDGKGVGAASALRGAQDFVRSQDKWKHPRFWAAWVLWGLPE